MFYPSYKSQIKTSTEAVFEEDGGTAAVEASLRDDGHPVAQQICLIHVVGGQNDCAPWNRQEEELTRNIDVFLFSAHEIYTTYFLQLT